MSTSRCGPSPLGPAAIRDLVAASADRHGVDRGLATAIAWVESRFDQVRNSPKGARGTMQLMPATAQRYGVRDVCDPASNIDGGVRYLRSLIDQFGNPLLAAAAYNAGEQPIYDHHGVPPYPETVAYVAAILNYQLGLQPLRVKGATLQSSGDGERSSTRSNSVIGATTTAKFVGGVMQF
ncbi:soluble lytic murein transglycosylase-like protein [Rhizobium tibeticum]|uniref:lytic transglycosylase domain-containing protein n=1 Tax=Rhizobium tibeticum TaxID=501024 RepID=UPI002788DE4F|nr:soluble lytic murein transglycosylase-like protein [Rhizobium tibeticum]